MGHDVFISHSSKDKVIADAICAVLERNGVRCWVAPRDILPGANWANSILKAITASRMMLLVFSSHTQSSNHIRREVERAVHHGLLIAPLRIEDVAPAEDFEYFLSSSHWLDAMHGPMEEHLEQMAVRVRTLLEMEPRPGLTGGVQNRLSAGPKTDSPLPTTPVPQRAGGRSLSRVLVAVAATVLVSVVGTWAALRFAGSRTEQADAHGTSVPLTQQPAGPVASTPSSPATLSPFTNPVGMSFVYVPAGSFLMGSLPTEAGRDPDETAHRVHLTKPFLIAACPVTRGQFATFARDTKYQTDAEREGWAYVWNGSAFEKRAGVSWRNPGFDQADDHPAVCVSWNDAAAMAQWLCRQEGRNYRLPTEAEWEYACRAGSTTAYPWADAPAAGAGWTNAADLSTRAEHPNEEVFPWDDGFGRTSPVGRFKPNAWGLYDMNGNVMQWCADFYQPHPAVDAVDPLGAFTGTLRVMRGGSWFGTPRYCRSARRSASAPDFRSYLVGIRLCVGS